MFIKTYNCLWHYLALCVCFVSAILIATPSYTQTTQAPIVVEIHSDRSIIPEGGVASILVRGHTAITSPITIGLALHKQNPDVRAELSTSFVVLSQASPIAVVTLVVDDNTREQVLDKSLDVMFSSADFVRIRPSDLRFTIPPNDLVATLQDSPASLKIRDVTRRATWFIKGEQTNKSLIVSSADPRIIVHDGMNAGVSAFGRRLFHFTLSLNKDAMFSQAEFLPLQLSHLDLVKTSTGAQIVTGLVDTCVVKTDDAVSCWDIFGSKHSVPSGAVSYTHLTLPTICSV